MEVDIHRIITTRFNVHLNKFISKLDENRKKSKTVILTGGLWEIWERQENILDSYARWLKGYRDELFRSYFGHPINVDTLQKALDPLLQFYVNRVAFSQYDILDENNRAVLAEELLKPLMSFFRSLDKYFATTYFRERINALKIQSPEIIVKVVNLFSLPISETVVKMERVLAQIFGEYSKTIPIGQFTTDTSGSVRIKLIEGQYKIDVDKYRRRKTEDFHRDTETVFKVFDFTNLLKHLRGKA
jgi:hypothetical protein